MSARPTLLVLAIGNPDRGDDAIGAAVAAALRGCLPEGVELVICTGDLLSMIEEWKTFDAMICIDATAPQGQPGRIRRFDLATGPLPVAFETISSHAFGLGPASALAQSLHMAPAAILVFGIEGESFATGLPLSSSVAAAIAPVAESIIREAHNLLEGEGNA